MRGRQSSCSLQVIFKAVSEVNVANQNLELRVFTPSNQCFLQLLPGKMYFWMVFATVGGVFFATARAFLATMSNVFCTGWVGAVVGAAGAGAAFCSISATAITSTTSTVPSFAPPPASPGALTDSLSFSASSKQLAQHRSGQRNRQQQQQE